MRTSVYLLVVFFMSFCIHCTGVLINITVSFYIIYYKTELTNTHCSNCSLVLSFVGSAVWQWRSATVKQPTRQLCWVKTTGVAGKDKLMRQLGLTSAKTKWVTLCFDYDSVNMDDPVHAYCVDLVSLLTKTWSIFQCLCMFQLLRGSQFYSE